MLIGFFFFALFFCVVSIVSGVDTKKKKKHWMINRWAILVYRQLRYFIIPVYINVYFFYIYAYLSLTMTINICSILSYMRKKSVNMFFF